MTKQEMARQIVDRMYFNDPFSLWLGIERIEEEPGRIVLRMKVRREMLNGFGIAHGGAAYALADSALAFAANSHGRMAVSVETSISHTLQVQEGDELTASTTEEHLSDKIGHYSVHIKNQNQQIVAIFRGTVYRTSKVWNVGNP